MEYVRSLTDALGLTSAAAEEQGDAPNPLGDPIVVNVDDQSECLCVCARAEEGELGAVLTSLLFSYTVRFTVYHCIKY